MVPYFRILPLTNEVVMLKIVQSDEEINSNGGLALVKGLMDANPAMRQWDSLLPVAAQARFGTSGTVRCMIGLMTNGRDGSFLFPFRFAASAEASFTWSDRSSPS